MANNTLAFQLYSLRQYEDGYQAAFEAVRDMGIDTIEVWSGAVRQDTPIPSVDALSAKLRHGGMKLTCGHIALGDYQTHFHQWQRLLLDLGSTDWVIPFAKADSLEEWLGLLPRFRQMADRLAEDGLNLGYHNHHRELAKLGDRHVMEHLLDNMPALRAQFHIGQFTPALGISLPDWIRKYEGRICSLHLNDATDEGPAPLGQGTCKAEESIKAALDSGVDTFIVEVPLTRSTADAVRRDVEFANKLLG